MDALFSAQKVERRRAGKARGDASDDVSPKREVGKDFFYQTEGCKNFRHNQDLRT